MMKFGSSPQERKHLLLLVLLAGVTLTAYVIGAVGPLQRNAGTLGIQVREARDRVKALELATANEDLLRQQHQQLNETVASLRKLLPPEEQVPAIIELLSNLAGQSSVKIQTIVPLRQSVSGDSRNAGMGDVGVHPLVYKEVPIEIDAIAGFHQLGTFLSAVESGERPMRLSSLRISGNPKEPKRHHIKLVVWLYVVPSQSETSGGSRGQGPTS